MDEPWVDLAAAIAMLREQLTSAIEEGKDKGMHFQLAPIELSLQAALTAKGNGKLGWKVLEVGGGVESAATQTLTLTLTPAWKMRNGTLVPDPLIAAALPSAAGEWQSDYGQAEGPGPAEVPHHETAAGLLDEQITDD